MIYFVGINVISFMIYGLDKYQAIRKKYRIPEKLLLLLTYIGGCFGAFLAMIIFHHKTKKVKFRLVIPAMLLVWTIILLEFGGII